MKTYKITTTPMNEHILPASDYFNQTGLTPRGAYLLFEQACNQFNLNDSVRFPLKGAASICAGGRGYDYLVVMEPEQQD